jgi:hypothetical protein
MGAVFFAFLIDQFGALPYVNDEAPLFLAGRAIVNCYNSPKSVWTRRFIIVIGGVLPECSNAKWSHRLESQSANWIRWRKILY